MQLRHRLRAVVMAFLFLATIGYSGISYAYQTHVSTGRPARIQHENCLIKQAVTKLGNEDNGEAILTYYRHHHVLQFQVTNFNFKDKFQCKSLDSQVRYFQHRTHLMHINVEVEMTDKAIRSHHVQMSEQAQQQAENHAEAVKEEKKAQQEAELQARRITQKKAQQAKRKAEQQRKKKEAQQHNNAVRKAKQRNQKNKAKHK